MQIFQRKIQIVKIIVSTVFMFASTMIFPSCAEDFSPDKFRTENFQPTHFQNFTRHAETFRTAKTENIQGDFENQNSFEFAGVKVLMTRENEKFFAAFERDGRTEKYKISAVVGAKQIDASGEFYFSSATGTSTGNEIYGLNLLPNTNHSIRVDNPANFNSGNPLAGLTLTSSNIASQSGFADGSDSDTVNVSNPTGSPTSSVFPVISLTTGSNGQNNHNYDFGFRSGVTAANVSVGGRALDNWWNGIAGVEVTLTTMDGVSKIMLTDEYSYFVFEQVEGQAAVVTVRAKGKNFTPENQFVSLPESTEGLYFFAKKVRNRQRQKHAVRFDQGS